MTDFTGEGGLWVQRLAGASAGAAVSLIHLLPHSRREAASRLLTGLGCGVVFGKPMGIWLSGLLGLKDALDQTDIMISGSAAASLSAWWGLGLLARLVVRLHERIALTKKAATPKEEARHD